MDSKDIFKPYDKIKDDLKFITASDIKIKILISLKEGPKKLSDLKKDVHFNSSTILHNMRQLENKNIISKEFQYYSLSQTGEIITHNLINFLKSIHIIKNQKEFWLEHNIDSIPQDSINRIECLRNVNVCTLESVHLTLKKLLLNSNNINCIFSYPIYENKLYNILFKEKDNSSVLLSGEYSDISLKALENKNFYSLNNKYLGLNLIVLDNLMFLNIPYINGIPDHDQCLISKGKEEIKWGNKLLNYYFSQLQL
ncbi:helix-turn-helix transcriptional regulator [Methanobacterium sp. ACI-7]|uniref:helix-turn-helix transcriptional regulator n=1 Tax=unclassified Methanobacterium TaxID=2627676 RepID=UPI0039C353B9